MNQAQNTKVKKDHHPAYEWLRERVAGAIAIPLLIWFIIDMIRLSQGQIGSLREFLSSSWNATFLVLFIGNFLFYATLAIKVVFEDYVQNIKIRNLLILLTRVISIFAFMLALMSVTTIYNG